MQRADLMSGLEALRVAVEKVDDYDVDAGDEVPRSDLCKVLYAARDLLAAHPAEPAPVADPARITEVMAMSFHKYDLSDLDWDGLDPIARLAYTDEARLHATALLAAGVFRSEAEVKAEALEEAAELRHGITKTRGDAVDKYLRNRAAFLRAGDPS
jgi:hypothetical protein